MEDRMSTEPATSAAPATVTTEAAPAAPPPPPAATEAAPSAAPPADAPKDAPPEQPNAARFAAAARKERELRQRERQIKEAEERVAKSKSFEESFNADPLKALESLGWSFERLTNHVVDSLGPVKEKTPAEVAREAAAEEYERRETEGKKRADEERSRNLREAEAQLLAHVTETLKKPEADYETVSWAGDPEAVVQAMTDIFARDRRMPTIQEAAKMAEETLVNELVERLATVPTKVRQKLLDTWTPKAPSEPEKPQEPAVAVNPMSMVARTLTNRIAADTTPAKETAKPYDPNEAFQRALRIMQATRA
jgi:hypothetical protein